MSEAVHAIVDQIRSLPTQDRRELEAWFAQEAEAGWRAEADQARRLAQQKGIDQAAIDRAIEKVRHGS